MDNEILESLDIGTNTIDDEGRESLNAKIYEELKKEGFDFEDVYDGEIEEVNEEDYEDKDKYLEDIRKKQMYIKMPKFLVRILENDTNTCSKFNEVLRKLHRFKNISIYDVIMLLEEEWFEFYNPKHPFYVQIEELLDDLNFALLQAAAKEQFGLSKNIDNDYDEFLD